MKKKLVLFILIAAVLCAVFSGCNNANPDTDSTTTSPVDATQRETAESTEPTAAATPNIDELTYPQYNAMTAEQQKEVVDSFDSLEEFFEWHNQAKDEYEQFQDFINQGGTNDSTEPTGDSSTDPTGDENTETTVPEETDPAADKVTFLEYQAMSGNEQMRFMSSFPSVEAFMQWHSAAVQEYKDSMTEWGSSNTPTDPTIPTIETEG